VSRAVHRAPLALASDGTVLLNVAEFDEPKNIEDLVRTALKQRGVVFIGITANSSEVRFIMERIHDAAHEAACLSAGRRQRRARGKR
jgi:hypothetical protein